MSHHSARLRSALRRLRISVTHSERGSMIILAVAVLAVLSVTAAAYITVARIDRVGASVYQRSTSFESQVNVVVDNIGARLTGDLFGGKIVTTDTPQTAFVDGAQTRVWPRAFEDGEYSDYPRTSFYRDDGVTLVTFDQSEPGEEVSDDARLTTFNIAGETLRIFEAAPADDCWLASTEPVDQRSNGGTRGTLGPDGQWDTWPQISNLRCGWVWRDPDGPNMPDDPTWVREDGRFVDLGQWLIQNLDGRGDPAANLMYEVDPVSRKAAGSDSQVFDPLIQDLIGSAMSNGPEAAINQPVYGVQMSQIADAATGRLASNLDAAQCATGAATDCQVENRARLSDERFWADCDGDTYPDCRWQKIDALGDLFGLRWIVAARIVDHSALVNMNSSLAFNYGNGIMGADGTSDGMTPADVDLARLLRRSAGQSDEGPGHPDVKLNRQDANKAIRNSFNNGLRLREDANGLLPGEGFLKSVFTDVVNQPLRDELATFNLQPTSLYNGNNIDNLSRQDRFAYYRFVGASPQRPRVGDSFAYPQGDEIDLRTFWGFNNPSLTAKFEDAMDGFKDSQYVVGGGTAGLGTTNPDVYAANEVGLVRSKEATDERRTYRDNVTGVGTYNQREKVQRVMRDVRHLMTTVSGVGRRSPVPILNTLAPEYRNQTFLEKPTVSDAFDSSKGANSDFIRRAFDSFVWALAPFATDRPLMHPMLPADMARLTSEFHYGGTLTNKTGVGGATLPEGPATAIKTAGGVDMGASYAILRALALAVNLHDALDRKGPATGAAPAVAQEEPTIVRLFPDNDVVIDPKAMWIPKGGALTTRFPQGDINVDVNSAILPSSYLGLKNQGITAVGLETQPFLVSATVFTAYEDDANGGIGSMTLGGDPPTIDLNNAREQLGTLFIVELGNPCLWTST